MRPSASRVVAAALAALLCGGSLVLAGCGRTETVDLTGNVVDNLVVVQAPAIPVPSPDLEAGFRSALGATAAGSTSGAGASGGTTPTATRITGLGSFVRVDSVAVKPGDTLTAGQLIATLDTALLDANVRAARAAQRVAQAQVPVVDAILDDLAGKRADIADTRSTVRSTIAELEATRARLIDQLATLRATLKRVESLTGGGAFPPGSVPPSLPPSGLPTSTPGGGGGLPPGGLPPGGLPPGGLPDVAKLKAGIAQLEAVIAKLDSGLAQARSGLGRLSDASAKIADARAQLRHVRTLARIAAAASAVGVDLALYQRSLAEVRAPVAGVVVKVVSAGDVIAPGATVAEIRQPGRARVAAWLAPSKLPRVSVGDTAWIGADWLEKPVRGRITSIGQKAEYPPTSSATKDVHLTRAVKIEITADAGHAALPPGTPVDISIVPSSKR